MQLGARFELENSDGRNGVGRYEEKSTLNRTGTTKSSGTGSANAYHRYIQLGRHDRHQGRPKGRAPHLGIGYGDGRAVERLRLTRPKARETSCSHGRKRTSKRVSSLGGVDTSNFPASPSSPTPGRRSLDKVNMASGKSPKCQAVTRSFRQGDHDTRFPGS